MKGLRRQYDEAMHRRPAAGRAEDHPVDALKRGRWLSSLLALIVVVGVFAGLLPRLGDYSDVWRILGDVGLAGTLAALGATVVNQLTNPSVQMAVIPGLRFREALLARLSSTSLANTVPAGGAVGVAAASAMLSSWGIGLGAIARSVVMTGLANNGVRLAMPLAVLPLLAANQEVDLPLRAAVIGAALLAIGAFVVYGLMQTDAVTRLAERAVVAFRRHMRSPVELSPGLRRHIGEAVGPDAVKAMTHRWPALLGATILSQLTLFAVLLVSLRAVGVSPSQIHWSEALAAFTVVRLLSLVPLSPGALGVAEAGYATLLGAGLAEAPLEQVLAGVLLFRFATYLLPVPAGAVAAYVWRRRTDWRRSVEQRSAERSLTKFGMVVHQDWLESTECFRCGSDGIDVYQLAPFGLVECPNCQQTFVNPRLNAEGRLALYGNAEYFDEGVYKSARSSALQRVWARGRLDLIEQVLDESEGSVFEIGCAYGAFLESARDRAFAVAGLELSPVAAQTTEQRLGVPILLGEVVDLDTDEDHDAVVFWDVIEHVPDPAAFLAAARRLARPGGVIALSCPYYDSVPARLLRSRWWSLKPHKHIWHFTVDDLRRLLEEAGLEVERIVRSPLAPANLGRLDSLVAIARVPAAGRVLTRRRRGSATARYPR